MPDLFTQKPTPKIGGGNAKFLADLAEGVPDETMRQRYKAGEYPDLHTPSIPAMRKLAGRS